MFSKHTSLLEKESSEHHLGPDTLSTVLRGWRNCTPVWNRRQGNEGRNAVWKSHAGAGEAAAPRGSLPEAIRLLMGSHQLSSSRDDEPLPITAPGPGSQGQLPQPAPTVLFGRGASRMPERLRHLLNKLKHSHHAKHCKNTVSPSEFTWQILQIQNNV